MNICNLGKTEVILEMPWLAAHNLEINWETREVKIMRYPHIGTERVRRKRESKERQQRKKKRLSVGQ